MPDGKQWEHLNRRSFTKAIGLGGAVGLAGCSGQSPAENTDGGGGSGGNGGGSSSGPGTVAMLNPLSGGAAVGGENIEKGVDLRLQELEESDGIDGTMPDILSENDQCSAETAVSITQELVSSHPNLAAWVGGYCSPTTLSTMQTTRNEEITHIVTSAAPGVTEEGHPYMFRIFPKTTQTAALCVDYAINEIGAERIAVLGINNAWGEAITNNWRTLVEQSDQAEMVSFNQVSLSTQDYSNQLNSIRASDPDLIYALGYHGQTANMLSQIEDMGMTIGQDVDVFIASIAGAILNDIAGEDTLANVHAPMIFQGPTFTDFPEGAPSYMVDFVDKWDQAYDTPAIRESATGYALGNALVTGMQEAGTTSDGAAIAEALHGLEEPFDTPLGPIQFRESGQAQLEIFISQYNENGQLERLTEPRVPDTSAFN